MLLWAESFLPEVASPQSLLLLCTTFPSFASTLSPPQCILHSHLHFSCNPPSWVWGAVRAKPCSNNQHPTNECSQIRLPAPGRSDCTEINLQFALIAPN